MMVKLVRHGCILIILSTVALPLLLFSCGLPTVAFLNPPAYFSFENSGIAIKNDSNNYDESEGSTQTYKGIEIFYRVYSSEPAATSTIRALETLASNYSEEPDSFISVVTGTSYKFSRLRNTSTPLIPIEASDESLYFLSFYPEPTDGTSDWILKNENGNKLTDGNGKDISQVTRTLDSNPNSSSLSFFDKDFNVGVSSTDSDFAGSVSTTSSDKVYIVFFTVSYGIDQNTVGQTVYSAPLIATSPVEY